MNVSPSTSGFERPRVLLIIGGTGGIGLAVARGYLERDPDIRLIITYRSNEGLAHQLELQYPGRVRAFSLDLGSVESVETLADTVVDSAPDLRAVILAAGLGGAPQVLVRGTAARVRDLIDVNLFGPVVFVQALMKRLIKRGRPTSFVAISSVSAIRGEAGMTVYAAAKAGLETFFRCCAIEYGRRGYRFNIVRAGPVMTGMTEMLPAQLRAALIERLDCDSMPDPGSLFSSILFAADPEFSAGMNGGVIQADHGYGLRG